MVKTYTKQKFSEEEYLNIANASKLVGIYRGMDVISNPYIEPGIIYLLNENMMFPKPTKQIKKKKHIRRERKTPIAKLKRQADSLMSKYIIARDKKCVICGSTKNLNNGHLISRRCNSVRWDDVNCNCQCYPCNFLHTHRPERYTQWFIKNYGSLMYEDLVDRSRKLVKVNRAYLEDIISFIQEKHIILENST